MRNQDIDYAGFGYDPVETTFFVLDIPRDEEAAVCLCKFSAAASSLTMTGVEDDREPEVRLPQNVWNRVESLVRVYFNHRLRGASRPMGLWRFGENQLSEELGSELAVLLWGLEAAANGQVAHIYENWRKLTPEERRWLYRRVDSAPKQADPEVGWRRAVQVALLEEPARNTRPAHPVDNNGASTALPTKRESAATRRRKAQENEGQLRLM